MSQKTSNQDNLQPSQTSPALDEQEAPDAIVTELTPRRRTAGKPEVKADTAKPKSVGSGSKVVVPGLGKVTLVLH